MTDTLHWRTISDISIHDIARLLEYQLGFIKLILENSAVLFLESAEAHHV